MNISNNNNTTTTKAGVGSKITQDTSMSDSCEGASISNDDVCDVNDMLQNMSTADDKDDIIVSICANCGKEGNDINNVCNKCNQVKYCNAVCKKKHRHKHKKECEEHVRLAAEHEARLHEEKLFKQPPPEFGDCPICFLRLPALQSGWRYQTCCGKVICSGCSFAPVYDNQGNKVDKHKCPFCRTPDPITEEEAVEREKKRVKADDPYAIHNQGNAYRDGMYGLPRDIDKALELWHRSAEYGCTSAYCNIGLAYQYGQGVEIDKKKARHYWELAAMGGDIKTRYNLGVLEQQNGNMNKTLKHWMIAVENGCHDSLKSIKWLYKNDLSTKEEYMKALRLYQEYLDEIKSDQRDKAAAASERFRYY